MKHLKQLLVLLLIFGFTEILFAQSLEKLYVINEGAFGNSNASVTLYNPEGQSVTQNVFATANGRALGDIAAHSQILDGKLYILVSNSNKIEIVDPQSFSSLGTILFEEDEASSPMHFVIVDGMMYLANLFSNFVTVLDLESKEVVDTIEVGFSQESIAYSNGNLYVVITSFGDGNTVAVVDLNTGERSGIIEVHDNPRRILTDSQGYVWVVCAGDFGFDDDWNYDPDLETFGEIHIINPQTNEVETIIETGGHPSTFVIMESEGRGYLLNSGIQVVDLIEKEVLEDKLSETLYYSLGLWTGDEPFLFGGKVEDFSSAGSVDILSLTGELQHTFTAGIGPAIYQPVSGESTSLEAIDIPVETTLAQNFPNPFNPSTMIPFTLENRSEIQLVVYDMLGRTVAVLAQGVYGAGTHTVNFDAGVLSSGVYVYRLQVPAEGISITQRMTLLK